MLDEHRELHSLCDLLERMADGLPALDPKDCGQADAMLGDYIRTHHSIERRGLQAALGADGTTPVGSTLLQTVAALHLEEEELAEEIREQLAGGSRTVGADALGYMLRCWFRGYRKTMLIEALVAYALGRGRLGQLSAGVLNPWFCRPSSKEG